MSLSSPFKVISYLLVFIVVIKIAQNDFLSLKKTSQLRLCLLWLYLIAIYKRVCTQFFVHSTIIIWKYTLSCYVFVKLRIKIVVHYVLVSNVGFNFYAAVSTEQIVAFLYVNFCTRYYYYWKNNLMLCNILSLFLLNNFF